MARRRNALLVSNMVDNLITNLDVIASTDPSTVGSTLVIADDVDADRGAAGAAAAEPEEILEINGADYAALKLSTVLRNITSDAVDVKCLQEGTSEGDLEVTYRLSLKDASRRTGNLLIQIVAADAA